MNKKTLIAMSGGVDSSVSAKLMCDKGCDCVGAMMKLSNATRPEDSDDARRVAESLGIPFYVFDFSDQFRADVIDVFVRAYENGMTPNPCVICNRHLKFDRLMQAGRELSCEQLATGHYARVEQDAKTGRFLLKKALDPSKDQSYVLYSLTQDQLARVQFPLGSLSKDTVRKLAFEWGFANAQKSESQDICFIPDGNYAEFIEEYAGSHYPEGDFIDTGGHVLGRHKGIIRYTIGQRKGLGIAFGEPMYVLRVDPQDNTVTLGTNEDLFSDTLTAKDINLISCDRIISPLKVTAKVRYRHTEQPAVVEQLNENTVKVVFDEPQRAITPGQAVVFYDGDVVVGGGTITT